MVNGSNTKQSTVTAALAGFLFVLASGALIYLLYAAVEAAAWVCHSHVEQETLCRIEKSLSEIDSAARCFVITGNENILEPYIAARARLPVELVAVRKLAADSQIQQERVDELQQLADIKIRLAAIIIQKKRQGVAAEEVAVDPALASAALERVHVITRAMMQEESEQLLVRERAFQSLQIALFVTAALSGALGLVLLAWLIILIGAQQQASRYARSLIECSLDPLVTISLDGNITDVNAAMVEATGVSREMLIGTDLEGYFSEAAMVRHWIQEVLAKGFVADYPLSLRHQNGKLIEVTYNATVYRDVTGQVLGICAAARDITMIKRSEDRLRKVVEALPTGMIMSKKDGTLTLVNASAAAAFGYSKNELAGCSLDLLVPPPVRADKPDYCQGLFALDLQSVEDGEQAMAFLRKQTPYENVDLPDIVLLDLNLPGMNGQEVLAEIKSDPSLKMIPVVVLTNSEADEDILKSYLLQASCYVVKPIDLQKFVKVIKSIDEFWFTAVRYPKKVGGT